MTQELLMKHTLNKLTKLLLTKTNRKTLTLNKLLLFIMTQLLNLKTLETKLLLLEKIKLEMKFQPAETQEVGNQYHQVPDMLYHKKVSLQRIQLKLKRKKVKKRKRKRRKKRKLKIKKTIKNQQIKEALKTQKILIKKKLNH